MSERLLIETQWLEQVEASLLVGIALLNDTGQATQVFIDDPALRIMIADYFRERARLQALHDRSYTGSPKAWAAMANGQFVDIDDVDLELERAFQDLRADQQAEPKPYRAVDDMLFVDDATEYMDFKPGFERLMAHRLAEQTPDPRPPETQ